MARRRCVNSPYRITTVYGNVPGYPLNNGFHTGVDYVSNDSLIVAPMDSTVVATGYDSVNGNYLVLESNGYRDWFAHIKEYKLKSGSVKAGQALAVMGATGAADGVHVHHSLRVNGVMVDPEKYITEEDMINKEDVAPVRVVMSEVEGWDSKSIHNGSKDGQIMAAWTGKKWQDLIMNGWYKNQQKRQTLLDNIASRDKQIAELKSTLSKVQAKADLSDSLQKKVDGLLSEKQKDTETGNAFVRWIGGLFRSGQ